MSNLNVEQFMRDSDNNLARCVMGKRVEKKKWATSFGMGLLWCLVAVIVLGHADVALAQGRLRGGGEGGPKALMETRFEQIKQRVLQNRVGLDEATAAKVSATIAEFAPQRRAIRNKIIETRQSIRDLLQTQNNDQNKYEQHLNELKKLRKEMIAVHEKEMEALSKLMTPKQRATLLFEITELQKQFRKAWQKRGKGGGGFRGFLNDDVE